MTGDPMAGVPIAESAARAETPDDLADALDDALPKPGLGPMAVGEVRGLYLSFNEVEFIRRIVARELREESKRLTAARPKDGQSRDDFAAFLHGKRRKVVFLDGTLAAIGRARVQRPHVAPF